MRCGACLHCFQSICSLVIPTHFDVLENALPELVEAEEVERKQAVSTAMQWVNQSISEELQGMEPSSQAEVDLTLRYGSHWKVEACNGCLSISLWNVHIGEAYQRNFMLEQQNFSIKYFFLPPNTLVVDWVKTGRASQSFLLVRAIL